MKAQHLTDIIPYSLYKLVKALILTKSKVTNKKHLVFRRLQGIVINKTPIFQQKQHFLS